MTGKIKTENFKMNYLEFLEKEIHSVVAATTDKNGLPQTCVIDVMDSDENGIYFLTASFKDFYKRLKQTGYIALTGMKGEDTLSSISISVHGKVKEIGQARLKRLLDKNPYMYDIYPTEEKRRFLTVFQLYDGIGEWYDLSILPAKSGTFKVGRN